MCPHIHTDDDDDDDDGDDDDDVYVSVSVLLRTSRRFRLRSLIVCLSHDTYSRRCPAAPPHADTDLPVLRHVRSASYLDLEPAFSSTSTAIATDTPCAI